MELNAIDCIGMSDGGTRFESTKESKEQASTWSTDLSTPAGVKESIADDLWMLDDAAPCVTMRSMTGERLGNGNIQARSES